MFHSKGKHSFELLMRVFMGQWAVTLHLELAFVSWCAMTFRERSYANRAAPTHPWDWMDMVGEKGRCAGWGSSPLDYSRLGSSRCFFRITK
ncbi:hypothetical protein CEXT_486181 [Caerostris extrusa]|uniref:Secreted protein n=1 Tax=Caerostris extrusa TaxID=172846 RepID=A0AAV4N294_CAEEX|nr:hypothetical protein CEXT_486181 [Caerostris extrusa]